MKKIRVLVIAPTSEQARKQAESLVDGDIVMRISNVIETTTSRIHYVSTQNIHLQAYRPDIVYCHSDVTIRFYNDVIHPMTDGIIKLFG